MAKAEIIFFVVVMVNITGLYFITKKFFRKRTVSGKKSSFSTVTKVFSVILNIALAYVVFWAVIFGAFCLSPYGIFHNIVKIYISDFITSLILLVETSIFLPYGLNLLLYKFWYGKVGLSKWWTFPAIIIGVGAFIGTIFLVISENFINGWSQAEWIWR